MTPTPSAADPADVGLPEGSQFLLIQLGVKNPRDESLEFCKYCRAFALLTDNRRLTYCTSEFDLPDGLAFDITDINETPTLKPFPPGGTFEAGETRSVQLGSVISAEYDLGALWVGLDGCEPEFAAQWQRPPIDPPAE